MRKFTETEFSLLSDDEINKLDMAQVEIVPDDSDEAEESDDSSANIVEDTATENQEEGEEEENALSEEEAEEESEEVDESEEDATTNPHSDNDDDDDEENEETEEEGTSEEAERHKAFYDALTKPFKANGFEMTLNTPEEWISMAQKGANYTQKMQGLAPNLKLLRMLENHNLLDEDKLSFLIDLDKNDPLAVQKFMKDNNIDPMDVDTDVESTYAKKSYAVSDQEFKFQSMVKDVAESDVEGRFLIKDLNNNWDEKSADSLLENPEILQVLHKQVKSGVYATIMNEVKRREALGQYMAPTMLLSYKKVGEELESLNKLPNMEVPNRNTGVASTSSHSTPKAEVRTRTRRRVSVSEDKRAKAAAPSKVGSTSKSKPKKDFNPLAMSDEEFMKMFGSD